MTTFQSPSPAILHLYCSRPTQSGRTCRGLARYRCTFEPCRAISCGIHVRRSDGVRCSVCGGPAATIARRRPALMG
jgi:hypothetical protein